MVEHTTHNRAVAGSIPASATTSPVDAIRASGLIAADSRVLAAVSGGPDSTALLLALHELGVEVTAAHFDHALRPGSALDGAHVARLCARLGIRLLSERRAQPLAGGSIQAAARAARYEFLERARQAAGAELIATAHIAGDQAETVLMNILRGADVRGLRGIPARNGRIVRPLLTVTRSSVEQYLAARGQSARDDPSNRDLRFTRARVRYLLIPALPPVEQRLIRIAAAAAAAGERLAEAAPGGAEPAARRTALLQLYEAAGGPSPALARRHLTEMDRLLQAGRTGASLALPGGLRFRVLPGAVPEIAREGQRRPEAKLHQRQCPGCRRSQHAVHLAAGALTLGTRRPGLRIHLPAGRGTKKLQDLFVDAKVPRHERDSYPLVFLDGELAWVPGIAADARFTTPSERPGRHVWLGGDSPARW